MDAGFSLFEVLIALMLAASLLLTADFSLTHAASLNAKITQFYLSLS